MFGSEWVIVLFKFFCIVSANPNNTGWLVTVLISLEICYWNFLWKVIQWVIYPFAPKISDWSNSLYCLLYNSGDVSLKNLVLDKLMILQLIFLVILMYCLLDIVLVQWGEILSWYSQRVDYFKFVALFVIKEKNYCWHTVNWKKFKWFGTMAI